MAYKSIQLDSASKEYLEKSFLEELNYKIWSTRSSDSMQIKGLKPDQNCLILVWQFYQLTL